MHPLVTDASAVPASDCRLEMDSSPDWVREWIPVNAGFPLSPGRLGAKGKVNVLVVPYEFLDTGTDMQRINEHAGVAREFIKKFSRGTVDVSFRVSETRIKDPRSAETLIDLFNAATLAFVARDESKSFYGLVRNAITKLDETEDLSGIDSIIFQAGVSRRQAGGGGGFEAFGMSPYNSSFFRPYQTSEGTIFNAVWLGSYTDSGIYTHELMHNFGLVDLYPNGSGWSLMSDNSSTLFYWERWLLGWLRDDEIYCFDLRSELSLEPTVIKLSYAEPKAVKMAVVRTSVDKGWVIELREPTTTFVPSATLTAKYLLDHQALVVYSVNASQRPPYRLLLPAIGSPIGTTLDLNDLELLITKSSAGAVEVAVWSKSRSTDPRVELFRNEAKMTTADSRRTVVVKKTITCVKGKSVKKVTALNPKCPTGYKKR